MPSADWRSEAEALHDQLEEARRLATAARQRNAANCLDIHARSCPVDADQMKQLAWNEHEALMKYLAVLARCAQDCAWERSPARCPAQHTRRADAIAGVEGARAAPSGNTEAGSRPPMESEA